MGTELKISSLKMSTLSLNLNHPNRSQFEVLAMSHHHAMLHHASDEGEVATGRPPPQPIDIVSQQYWAH